MPIFTINIKSAPVNSPSDSYHLQHNIMAVFLQTNLHVEIFNQMNLECDVQISATFCKTS